MAASAEDRYLGGLCDGTLVGAHAITEADSGSDSFAMRLRAERIGARLAAQRQQDLHLQRTGGRRGGGIRGHRPDKGFHGGVTAFLIERGVAGFSSGQKFAKMGLRTSPVGELVFEDVLLADDSVLGTVGGGASVFGTAMDWERSLLVAAHVGTIERLLETSIAYARTRSQFGQTIGKFQAVAHKIADMKVHLEAARCWCTALLRD
jgi:alkylation response protein AidB-like acyl-CoA dehydrogenase